MTRRVSQAVSIICGYNFDHARLTKEEIIFNFQFINVFTVNYLMNVKIKICRAKNSFLG